MERLTSLEKFHELQSTVRAERPEDRPQVIISAGTCGQARGANGVYDAFRDALAERNLSEKVELKRTGCHGYCEVEPNALVLPQGVFYAHLEPKNIAEIVDETIVNGRVVEKYVVANADGSEHFALAQELPFYRRQQRNLLTLNTLIEPTKIEDYLALDGYAAFAKALSSMSRPEVIEEMKRSGLRGRGGGGFPTGMKWEFCYKEQADLKYVVCNADEGDPGAYMDRSLLEGNPHVVIEGMLIGAYAVGAQHGYIYVRDEYPIAVRHLQIAIEQARELGLLGESILGTDFSFELQMSRGAGAFVCGEETALLHSIESKRGMPRQRPPFPAQSGLWGKPTNINNVETWANVPLIVNKGADWFAAQGTEQSKGSKIFALVGKIRNTGLVEVPMGITLRELVYDVGGGIPNDKQIKAVQTGGPSGGCIPAHLLDLPVDFDALREAGSIMGSGGMVVMDEATCMVDVAKYFLEFLEGESCGKCTPCRMGTPLMLEIVERICDGHGTPEDLDTLESLAKTIKNCSLCGLGQTSPNPVLSTLRYFRDEYEAHVYDKVCPACLCQNLIRYEIDQDTCISCDRCRKACPVEAITGELKQHNYYIHNHLCIRCGACEEQCPVSAISRLPGYDPPADGAEAKKQSPSHSTAVGSAGGEQ